MLKARWCFTMIKVMNQRQFDVSLKKIAADIGIEVTLVVKKLAFDIFADVVAGTPVDTGRAMNNWMMSLGTPSRRVIEQGGSKGSVRSTKRAEAAATVVGLTPFSTVWISNNLPYIAELEEGSSDQAPRGWVEAAIHNNVAALASKAAQVGIK